MCTRNQRWCSQQPQGKDCCYYLRRHLLKKRKYRRSVIAVLIERDGAYCRFCGITSRLTKDHYVPRSRGGSDHLSNLIILCHDCNRKKGDLYPDDPRVERLRKI